MIKFLRLDPVTRRKFLAFRRIRRGFLSLIIFSSLVAMTLIAELLVNNRALIVHHDGKYYFPTYGSVIPGKVFGLNYEYETNYRELKHVIREKDETGFVIMPIVPYNAFENDLPDGQYPPSSPSIIDRHFLGTDTSGRDILARLVYGFRESIWFSLMICVGEYVVGVIFGFMMGYFGGRFDLFMQRLIEIWSNVPFLYIVIIISSIAVPNFWSLVGIILLFAWVGMTTYMRSAAYKERLAIMFSQRGLWE